MKNYTRFEHEDMMFSFNYDGILTEDILINKLTDFLLAMPTKVSTTVEFNIRITFEDMLREEEARINAINSDYDFPY